MESVLFKTVHGSHLYGLNHAGSDIDFYIVTGGKKKTQQTIVDGIDTTVVSFPYFVDMCLKGVPQALEAMFSEKATVDDFESYRINFRAGGSKVIDTYLRTIKSFTLDGRHDTRYKRHAIRLALNLNGILKDGRFNPTLSQQDKETMEAIMLLGFDNDIFMERINNISYIQVFN